MQLDVSWDGSEIPFEGDRTVPVLVIPAGAQVLTARVSVTPVDPGGSTASPDDSFVEHIRFSGIGPRFGANIAHGSNFVEVDFRARRTLAAVTSSGLTATMGVSNGTLQIDPGGVYVQINSLGAIFSPNDDLFLVNNGRQALPSFVAARFKITDTTGAAPDLSEVEVRSVPENVSLRLGDQPVFHTFLGPLTEPETSIDFATLLTEFLQTATIENGHYVVPIVIHSDTIARLQVAVTLDVLQAQQPMQGPGESLMDFTVDAIPVGAATSFRLQLPLEAEAVPGRTAVRFQGAFDDTRVAFGPLAPELSGDVAGLYSTISAHPRPQAQAQPFTLTDANVNVTGIDLLLTPVTQAAEVLVDIRDDLGGKPGAQSLLVAPLKIDIRQQPSEAPQWLTVDLPQERHLEKGRPLWLIVQRSLGDAAWSARPASALPPLQQTDDNGLSWRKSPVSALPAAEGLFRLRHRPPAFTMPIHVFVGEGDARREVPLDEFEPLGRVDFTLDTESFAATINQVLSASAAMSCQPVEHLANGDLEEWFRVGNEASAPRSMQWTHPRTPAAVTISPDALYFYTLDFDAIDGTEPATLRRFDALCLEERADILLPSPADESLDVDDVGGLAIDPSGRLLFASRQDRVWVVDLGSFEIVGSWREQDVIEFLATGGGRLYFAKPGTDAGLAARIDVVRISAVEDGIRSGTAPQSTLLTSLLRNAEGIAVSLTGDVVLVTLADQTIQDGILIAFDAEGHEQWRIASLGFSPAGVGFFPQGARAVIGDRTHNAIGVINLARRHVGPGPTITIDPARLALAAISGDRLVVSGEGAGENQFFEIVDFGTPVPKHWDITSGKVQPVCLGDPFHIGAQLGQDGIAPISAFSQVVAATGGCTYDFSFWASAASDGAAGEVIWRGSRCAASRTDTVPIRPEDLKTFLAGANLTLHRARLHAPADATQAEVRFRASDGVIAVVDLASLKPPDGPVGNPDLIVVDDEGLPEGWTLEPPGSPAFQFADATARNLGLDPIALIQEIVVTGKDTFRLEFRGTVSHGAEPPVAAVHWLDADAPPVELTLTQDGPNARVAESTVPVGATRAEISLTLPGGSEVSVEHFAMRVGVMTGVLFSVFAEAPGSLTVSQFQVVTDTKTPTPPPPPPEGLCPVTTPGDDCESDEEKDSHYCPSCSSHQSMAVDHHAVLEGRPVRTVTCENCRTRLIQNVGTLHHARRAPLLPTFAIPRRVTPSVLTPRRRAAAPLAPLTPVIAPRPSPLLAVRGISAAEVRALNQHGIATLQELVDLDIDAMALLLPARSVTRARFLHGLARRALEG